MSRIGKVVDEGRAVRMEVVAAKAESVKETLRAQMASFSAQMEASVKRAIEVMEGRV